MRTFSLAAVFVLATITGTSASAANLGVADDYSFFSLGDVNFSNSQSEGRIAAYHDITLTNYAAGTTITYDPQGPSTVIAGNHLNITDGAVLNGGVSAGGNVTFTYVSLPDGKVNADGRVVLNLSSTPGGVYHGAEIPFDFDAVKQSCEDTSARLAALSANGTATQTGGILALDGKQSSLNVFHVDAANLAKTGLFEITAPPGSTVVVNVDGDIGSISALKMDLHGVDAAHVLINFPNATALTVSQIQVEGSILAPNADVQFTNGEIDGTLIGGNLSGNGFAHLNPFEGTIPGAVPEPGALLTLLMGAFAIAGMLGLRRRQTSPA